MSKKAQTIPIENKSFVGETDNMKIIIYSLIGIIGIAFIIFIIVIAIRVPKIENCGNGILDGREECDGTNLNDETCISQGFDSGTLSCTSKCKFDTSSCQTEEPPPTNGGNGDGWLIDGGDGNGGGGNGNGNGGLIGFFARFFTGKTVGDRTDIYYNDGYVGIGTSSPGSKLTIVDDQLKALKIESSHTYGAGISLNSIGENEWLVQSTGQTAGEGKGKFVISDQTNKIVGFVIENKTGNVGIGTTNPIQKLDVAGTVKATQYCIGASCITSWPAGSGGGAWTQSGTNVYYNGGNVGIGTSTPTRKLEVANGRIRALAFSQETSPVSGKGLELFYYDNAGLDSGYIQSYDWGANTYKQLRIYGGNLLLNPDGGGNVGIGTSTPTEKLDVAGKIKATQLNVVGSIRTSGELGRIAIESRNGNSMSFSWFNPTGDGLILHGGGGEIISLNNDGSVKINSLAGSGNDYACIDSTGKLYRSNVACA